MTAAFHLQYLRMKSSERLKEKERHQDSLESRSDRFQDSVRTRHSKQVDMTSAYQKVLDKQHKPTPEEIHFRRFTSGGWVDKGEED
jgi:hypothetical protein